MIRLITILIVIFGLKAKAQKKELFQDPQIGQSFPSYIFNNVQNGRTPFSVEEAKGKWLILDFWNEYCGACITSFPEINKIHCDFGDQVKIVSIGYNGTFSNGHSSLKSISTLFNRAKARYSLNFLVAYDSVLYEKFGITGVGCPYIVIVDPSGIVRFITDHIGVKDVSKIIKYDFTSMTLISRLRNKEKWHSEKSNIITECSLSLWDGSGSGYEFFPYLHKLRDDTMYTSYFKMTMSLDNLYRFAYTGNNDWDDYMQPMYTTYKYYPILNLKDSTAFKLEKKYTFSLKIPQGVNRLKIMERLQSCLYEAFGYSVTIEKREEPYWSLNLRPGYKENLISKGGVTSFKQNSGKFMGYKASNIPIKNLIGYIHSDNQLHFDLKNNIPFIDETGLTENIDISINAFTLDFDEVRAELFRGGIELRRKMKEVYCIVISQ